MENKLPKGFIVEKELDNSEWVAGVERGEKSLKKKTFVMLDKNKSAKENLATLKKAAQGK